MSLAKFIPSFFSPLNCDWGYFLKILFDGLLFMCRNKFDLCVFLFLCAEFIF